MLQIQEKTKKEITDLKHHLGTLQSNQLSEEELNHLYERLKYQVNILNTQIVNTNGIKTDYSSLPIRSEPKQKQKPQSVAFPKIQRPIPIREPSVEKRQAKKQIGKLKSAHIYKAHVLSRELRLNPFADPPAVEDQDLEKGVYNLIISGVIPKDVNVNAAFKRGGDLIQTQQAQFHQEKNKFYSVRQEDLSKFKVSPPQNTKHEQGQIKSQSTIQNKVQVAAYQQNQDRPQIRFILQIKNKIFQHDHNFMNKYLYIWGAITQLIKRLEQIASGQLDGNRLADLALSQFQVTTRDLYGCYISKPIMERLYQINKKQFNQNSAILKIQSLVKMFIQKRKFKNQRRIVLKVIRIQKEFRLKQMYIHTIKEIRKKLGHQISTLWNRQQNFMLEDIMNMERIEIHIPSFSILSEQRKSMSHFKNKEGLSLARLFALKDNKVSIIYICQNIPEEVSTYFYALLDIAGIKAEGRLFFIQPENALQFPQHFSLAQLLYFSPKALNKIRTLIEGKLSYIVPSKVGKEEYLIAEILKTHILSGPLEQINKFQKKSISKQLFQQINILTAPGCFDIKSKDDFIDKLSVMIMKNLNVSKWYFKVDHEFNGRGSAWFTLEGVKQFIEIKKNPQNLEWEQLRELVQALLPIKTVIAFPQMFLFDEFMEYFIKNGGVIEAHPQYKEQSHGKVTTINVHFIIEPQGQYTILNSSQSILIKDLIKIGATFPQQILANLDQIIGPLSDALYKEKIFGYVTLSLLCFGQNFYAKSLKFGYDEYFGAVQLAHSMGGDQFTYLPLLYNPGIGEQRYTELYARCRKAGISFDLEKMIGTLILMTDSIERGILSVLCLGPPRKSIKNTTDALNYLLSFGGNVVKNAANLKQDVIYFIEIVNRLRVINSEQ